MNYYSKDMVSLNYKKLNISWQNILFSIFVSKTTFSEITNFCWKFLLVTLLILLWLHERLSKQLSQLLYKKSVFKIFAKFARRHLCQSLFFNKVAGLKPSTLLKNTLAQVFSCEFCEIFKNIIFAEHLCTTASVLYVLGTNLLMMLEVVL